MAPEGWRESDRTQTRNIELGVLRDARKEPPGPVDDHLSNGRRRHPLAACTSNKPARTSSIDRVEEASPLRASSASFSRMAEGSSKKPPTREQELRERALRLRAMFARWESERTDEPDWNADEIEPMSLRPSWTTDDQSSE